MDNHNILKIITLIAIFISLLLSLFLVTVKTKNKIANLLLAGFILASVVDMSGIIIAPFLRNHPLLFEFKQSFSLLIFPILYHYFLSICHKNFRLELKSVIHATPFLLYNVLIISSLLFDAQFFNIYSGFSLFGIFNSIILKLQAFIYLLAIVFVLRNYRKVYLENYASGNISIYKWLTRIVFIFLITLPVTILKDFSRFGNYQNIFNWAIAILIVTALVMLSWFILKALLSPEIFRGIDLEIKPSVKTGSRKNDNQISNVELDKSQSIFLKRLKEHMIEKEPFLETNLSLQDLAKQINIPSRELSVLINQHIGQHFFDFINTYRIQKAVRILEEKSSKDFTIQQIFYDVGFNSKSSFNTAFKKHTQLTPTEYKKQHSTN